MNRNILTLLLINLMFIFAEMCATADYEEDSASHPVPHLTTE